MSVVNVNSNHSKTIQRNLSVSSPKGVSGKKLSQKKEAANRSSSARSTPIKKKKEVTDVEAVTFEEDGDLVRMEINDVDGGKDEFTTDEEHTTNETESESEDSANNSDSEEGQITAPSDQNDSDFEQETSQKSTQTESPRIKKRKVKSKRKSMEEKNDTLSDALLGLKEMFMLRNTSEEKTGEDNSKQGWQRSSIQNRFGKHCYF